MQSYTKIERIIGFGFLNFYIIVDFSRKIVNSFAMSSKLCNFTRFYIRIELLLKYESRSRQNY